MNRYENELKEIIANCDKRIQNGRRVEECSNYKNAAEKAIETNDEKIMKMFLKYFTSASEFKEQSDEVKKSPVNHEKNCLNICL